MAIKVYRIEVTEVQDRGNFFLIQGSSNEVNDPTAPSNHRATFIAQPLTDAKFDTLMGAIETAIDASET
jgi:hypothetical protein